MRYLFSLVYAILIVSLSGIVDIARATVSCGDVVDQVSGTTYNSALVTFLYYNGKTYAISRSAATGSSKLPDAYFAMDANITLSDQYSGVDNGSLLKMIAAGKYGAATPILVPDLPTQQFLLKSYGKYLGNVGSSNSTYVNVWKNYSSSAYTTMSGQALPFSNFSTPPAYVKQPMAVSMGGGGNGWWKPSTGGVKTSQIVQFDGQLDCAVDMSTQAGTITPTPPPPPPPNAVKDTYCGADLNNDGVISPSEIANCLSSPGNQVYCPMGALDCNPIHQQAQCPAGSTLNTSRDMCQADAVTTCPSSGAYQTNVDLCYEDAYKSCPTGYTYTSANNDCEMRPQCAAGTTYNDATNKCESTSSYPATQTGATDCTREMYEVPDGSYTDYNGWYGATTPVYVCKTPLPGQPRAANTFADTGRSHYGSWYWKDNPTAFWFALTPGSGADVPIYSTAPSGSSGACSDGSTQYLGLFYTWESQLPTTITTGYDTDGNPINSTITCNIPNIIGYMFSQPTMYGGTYSCPSGGTLSGNTCNILNQANPTCPGGNFHDRGSTGDYCSTPYNPTCNDPAYVVQVPGQPDLCQSAATHICPAGTTWNGLPVVKCEAVPICNGAVYYDTTTHSCYMGQGCPYGSQYSCVDVTGAGNYQCSPYACQNQTTSSTSTPQDPTYLQNDGQKDSNGNCLGQTYIFSGKPDRCRPPGLTVGELNDCCAKGNQIISDDTGGAASAVVSNLGTISDLCEAAYGSYLAGAQGVEAAGTYASGTSSLVTTSIGAAEEAVAAGASTAEGVTAGVEAFAADLLASPAVIIAIVVIIVMKVLMGGGCDKTDLETTMDRDSLMCHYIGGYCEKHFLGACVQPAQGYCCFNSVLARIIQEQGRPQLNDFNNSGDWGSPESPNCKGFTPDEFQGLDFSKIDLSEYFATIEKGIDAKLSGMQNKINGIISNKNTQLQK
jgi:hypothetical protein